MRASEEGNVEEVRVLLQSGIPVNEVFGREHSLLTLFTVKRES